MTPEAVPGQVRPDAGAVPRLRRAARRPERQPAQHPGRGGEDRDQVDRRSSATSTSSSPASTRSRARPATRCAPTSPRSCRTASSPSWSATSRSRRCPATWSRQQWDRDEVHQVFDTLEFRVLRDRLYATVDAAEPEAEEGFEVDRHGARPAASSRGWLARRTHRAPDAPACTSPATGASGTGDVVGVALATADGEGALVRPRRARPRRRAGRSRPGSPTPTGPRHCTTPRARALAFAARGWTLRGVTSDTALSAYLAPPRPAQLRPRRPRAALPAAASCAPRTTTSDGQLSLRRADRARTRPRPPRPTCVRARAVLELADALDTELEAKASATAAARRRAAAGRGARQDGAHRHRRRHRPPGRARGALRRRRSRTPPTRRSP